MVSTRRSRLPAVVFGGHTYTIENCGDFPIVIDQSITYVASQISMPAFALSKIRGHYSASPSLLNQAMQ